LQVEGRGDAEGVAGAAHGVEEIGVGGAGRVHLGAVCEDDVKADNGVEGETPETRCIAVAAVQKVSADADARTGAVGHGAFALVVEAKGEIAETNTAADGGNVGFCFRD
jgi:hypothetical protein